MLCKAFTPLSLKLKFTAAQYHHWMQSLFCPPSGYGLLPRSWYLLLKHFAPIFIGYGILNLLFYRCVHHGCILIIHPWCAAGFDDGKPSWAWFCIIFRFLPRNGYAGSACNVYIVETPNIMFTDFTSVTLSRMIAHINFVHFQNISEKM